MSEVMEVKWIVCGWIGRQERSADLYRSPHVRPRVSGVFFVVRCFIDPTLIFFRISTVKPSIPHSFKLSAARFAIDFLRGPIRSSLHFPFALIGEKPSLSGT